ncbi:hypothetical protein GPZ77_33450 [Streptomyces sp. QHH-9511]|uniref:hypothetical protein n=1 Tax=Streptomyces sp. QHH-9511 TaxID=2684468 RepID=UPI001318DD7E|nr:hypothetical protein [Streptomyces sp. QHH-9511]QGZ52564.1 hypothetical protein GPZ77_33450 [Streptomyces sp. QHH-9511]
MLIERLTIQMKLLANRPLKTVGLEFTPRSQTARSSGRRPCKFRNDIGATGGSRDHPEREGRKPCCDADPGVP